MPDTKPDKNGDYYGFWSPRGFANEGAYYRVSPATIDQIEKADADHRNGYNGGGWQWLDARRAIGGNSGYVRPVEDLLGLLC